MKALTLWRPWPLAFLRYGKRRENRGWHCPAKVLGTRIALHAGKRYDEEAAKRIATIVAVRESSDYPNGQLQIYYRVLDELHAEPYPPMSLFATAVVADQREYSFYNEELRRDPYAFGPVCWKMADLVEVAPIPCRGAQGIWTVPPEIEARLWNK